jgi:hypothetical protein
MPFAIKAVILFIIIYLLWQFIGPAYDLCLVRVSNMLSSSGIALLSMGRISLYHYDGHQGGIDSSALHCGLILVVALIGATPGITVWHRGKALAIAVGAVFAVHVLTLLALAGRNFQGDELLVISLLPVGCSLFPLLIYAVLTFRAWHPQVKPVRQSARFKTANQPSPVSAQDPPLRIISIRQKMKHNIYRRAVPR